MVRSDDPVVARRVFQDLRLRQRIGQLPVRNHTCLSGQRGVTERTQPALTPRPPTAIGLHGSPCKKAEVRRAGAVSPVEVKLDYVPNCSIVSSSKHLASKADTTHRADSALLAAAPMSFEETSYWSDLFHKYRHEDIASIIQRGGIQHCPHSIRSRYERTPETIPEFLQVVQQVKVHVLHEAASGKPTGHNVANVDITKQIRGVISDYRLPHGVKSTSSHVPCDKVETIFDEMYAPNTVGQSAEEDLIWTLLGGEGETTISSDRLKAFIRSQLVPLALNQEREEWLAMSSIRYIENTLESLPKKITKGEFAREILPLMQEVAVGPLGSHADPLFTSAEATLTGTMASLTGTIRSHRKSDLDLQETTSLQKSKKLFAHVSLLRGTPRRKKMDMMTGINVSPSEQLRRKLLVLCHKITMRDGGALHAGRSEPSCSLVTMHLEHLNSLDLDKIRWFLLRVENEGTGQENHLCNRVIRCLRRAVRLLTGHDAECLSCRALREIIHKRNSDAQLPGGATTDRRNDEKRRRPSHTAQEGILAPSLSGFPYTAYSTSSSGSNYPSLPPSRSTTRTTPRPRPPTPRGDRNTPPLTLDALAVMVYAKNTEKATSTSNKTIQQKVASEKASAEKASAEKVAAQNRRCRNSVSPIIPFTRRSSSAKLF